MPDNKGETPQPLRPGPHAGRLTDLWTVAAVDYLLAHWGKPHVTDDTLCFCGARAEDGVVVHRRMPWERPGQREGEA